MKIVFTVESINSRINPKTSEPFVSLSLANTTKVNLNGCVSTKKLYADYACEATTLKEGDKFIFDSENYNMVRREYVDVAGNTKLANSIKLANSVCAE